MVLLKRYQVHDSWPVLAPVPRWSQDGPKADLLCTAGKKFGLSREFGPSPAAHINQGRKSGQV